MKNEYSMKELLEDSHLNDVSDCCWAVMNHIPLDLDDKESECLLVCSFCGGRCDPIDVTFSISLPPLTDGDAL